MKIIFNDATELQIQKAYIDGSGALRVKVIGEMESELQSVFQDEEKTKRMVVKEREETLAEYENYTQYGGITKYVGGFLEPFLYKTGETPTERIAALETARTELEERGTVLEEKNEMLLECILELSGQVYK